MVVLFWGIISLLRRLKEEDKLTIIQAAALRQPLQEILLQRLL